MSTTLSTVLVTRSSITKSVRFIPSKELRSVNPSWNATPVLLSNIFSYSPLQNRIGSGGRLIIYRARSISLRMNTDFPLPVGPETIQVNGCASLLSMTRKMRIFDVHFYLYSQALEQSEFTLSYTISKPGVQCHICTFNIKAKFSNQYLQIYGLYRVRFKCYCNNNI